MNALRYIVLILGIGILIAQDPPGEFLYNNSTASAFYYFGSVSINGVEVESDDWVGAFNGDECVGARKWDTSLCGGEGDNIMCDVPAMGYDHSDELTEGYMTPGDVPTFKIYDASENSYYNATPSEYIPWSK